MQHLVVLRGPIGAGKTSLMQEVSRQLPDCSAIEIDALKRIADPNKSSPWRRNVALETGAFMTRKLLETGRSVVTEAHARWGEQTELFREVSRQLSGVAFSSFLVYAPYDVCLERATARDVPDIAYAIDEAMISSYYVNLDPLPGETVVDTSVMDPAVAAQYIINSISEAA